MRFNRSNIEEKESKADLNKTDMALSDSRFREYDRRIKSEIVEETPNDMTLKPQGRS